MKKKTILIFVCILFAGAGVMAQKSDTILASITYTFVHVKDTANHDNSTQVEMLLNLGATNSQYMVKMEMDNIRRNKKLMEERAKTPPANILSGTLRVVSGMPVAVVSSNELELERLYQLPGENKIIRTASISSQEYLAEMPAPKIDWKIMNDTRTIDKYTCHKAVGTFGGRTYAAWYTTELPFVNGPWKLQGLPGLILEAVDEKNEVSFLFKEINKTEEAEQMPLSQRKAVKASEEDIERARKNYRQNPTAAMQAQTNYQGEIPFYYKDASGKMLRGEEGWAALKKDNASNNNPLELGKK